MEFQALILCGNGKRLNPVTGETVPKALLPVANKPLVDHVLEWCQRASFKTISIVAPKNSADPIKEHLQGKQVQIITVNGEMGESFAQLEPLITGDFVVMPVDFITDVDPKTLVDIHRRHSDALVSGFYYRNSIEQIDKKLLHPDVLVASRDHKLLDSYTQQRVKEQKSLELRMAMLWKYPNAVVTTDLLAAGIYFCRYSVVEILADIESMDILDKTVSKLVRDLARRSWQHHEKLEPVRIHIIEKEFLVRANILPAYMEANRHLLKLLARSQAQSQARKQGGAKVSPDSLIDPSTEIADSTSVKRTAVGKNCKIGPKCILNGCVLLDGVNLGESIKLENCIIGRDAVIEPRCRLTSCTVGSGIKVMADTEAKNEILQGEAIGDDVSEIYESESTDGSGAQDQDDDDLEYDQDSDDDLFDRS